MQMRILVRQRVFAHRRQVIIGKLRRQHNCGTQIPYRNRRTDGIGVHDVCVASGRLPCVVTHAAFQGQRRAQAYRDTQQ
jgi:hypothetical protein